VRERVLEHLRKALNHVLRALKELEDTRRLCLRHGYDVRGDNHYSLQSDINWRVDNAVNLARNLRFAIKMVKSAREPEQGEG